MQGLANVACGVRTIRVLVEQSAARGEIQQRGARKKRQRASNR
jgi:hypothetical protein